MSTEYASNFQYVVEEYDDESLFTFFCPHTGPGDLGWVAEAAAKDFHSNHDGWESDWPLTFAICDIYGNRLGRAVVDRETVPQFRATNVTLGAKG
jgi:hypothetical protein